MTVYRGHFYVIRAQLANDRVHLISGQHEVAGDGGLAAAGRLEVDRDGYPQRSDGTHLHSTLGDRVAARNGKLIDAAVSLALGIDDLVELRRIEIHRRRGSGSRWRLQRSLALR